MDFLNASLRLIFVLTLGLATPASAAKDRLLTCSTQTACEFGTICTPSSSIFELKVLANGGAKTTRIQGSVRLDSTKWGTIAPYWFVREAAWDGMEMLYLGFDQSFVRVTTRNGAAAFRQTEEKLQRGGPLVIAKSEVTTTKGVCS
ncbi:hypothetical protein [Shimia sp. Alg240-R146]|uniref:hypothetical protein n=1 Tax=Shimia sp. Alg240-R146 TaxID=2993449 RepID=UPI0022E770B6|nr:hypothetical protein [Shimia sp. Alg240-R146]